MNKNTFKTALISMSLSMLIYSQTGIAQTSDAKSDNSKESHQGPPGGDRQGPPNGRPGGGGSPVQAESLDQMKGYKIGDVATDFSLKNVDGKMISLGSFKNAKGYIVTFTCNECPFAKLYEDRLIALNNEYAPKGYPVIAINPNSPENASEGYLAMQTRAKQKGFTFPYLVDEGQKIYPQFGALRTPHIFLLDKDLTVKYIGTIDDNAKSANDVKVKYVENAIQSLENGTEINPSFTKAIGCPIKASTK